MPVAASRGRFFPLTERSLARAVRGWVLTGRAPVRLRNPETALADAGALARLHPGRSIELFSLADETGRVLGANAAAQALAALAPMSQTQAPVVEGRGRAVLAFLQDGMVRLVEHRYKYRRGAFGKGEGLGTSRKPRITSETRTELAVLAIDGRLTSA